MKNITKDTTEGFMDFEHMLRQYFGEAEYQSQGLRRLGWEKKKFQKVISKIEEKIVSIETTERHKVMLLNEIEKLRKDLSVKDVDYSTVTIHLLSLVSRFLGYDFLKVNINTPVYFQTERQYYTQITMQGGDAMQHYYDGKNIILEQRKLIELLKSQGVPNVRIAQILNTTTYRITKILKEL